MRQSNCMMAIITIILGNTSGLDSRDSNIQEEPFNTATTMIIREASRCRMEFGCDRKSVLQTPHRAAAIALNPY